MKPYEMTGVLVSIGETVQKSDRFSIREFVLETGDDKYPNPIIFQLLNNNTDLINAYQEGETLKISFYIRGWSRGVNLNCVEIGCELDRSPEPVSPSDQYEPGIDFGSEQIPMGHNHETQPAIDSRMEPDETDELPF